MKKVLSLIMLLGYATAFSYELDMDYRDTINGALVKQGGDWYANSLFPLIDGNKDTYITINTLSGYPYFTLKFENGIHLDSIQWTQEKETVNGSGTGLIKELEVIALYRGQTNHRQTLSLPESTGSYEARLSQKVQANQLVFSVKSLYGNAVFAAIHEAGLYYRGSRLYWDNRTEAEQALVQSYRDYILSENIYIFREVKEVVFKERDILFRYWSDLGIDTSQILVNSPGGSVYLQTSSNLSNHGNIFIGSVGGGIVLEPGTKGKVILLNKMKVGEWWMDDRHQLWIRIGNGEWKQTGPHSPDATDLGMMEMVSTPYFE